MTLWRFPKHVIRRGVETPKFLIRLSAASGKTRWFGARARGHSSLQTLEASGVTIKRIS
ncbi:hypothetical protein HMPREF0580_1475 [Mobiluncus mulieris ATCC 35239]|uniref:Uncharacterized protein n=1 Tax=Mobiluncus mulieris ATCC 35239 TaxID=871571 RepID=E0QRG0_9ACTO|nr:hypothetical protein HMPREF0580_1475 [Mobiluncus mulieris ATCC 35239]EFN93137.1 hypothetical protein HMPREF9278_1501 [Mobiluncus mulieris FB024-16]